ncbi:hypothetical protein PVAND_016551 [Polypedilum vanderplanki]|uniref:Uncharacterized protein n=1 Tax=Polypedilum vanderplanki TaxID=319348 RepID=A0A9J6BG46_POLVA|nr:hypothetical protein PVAND_016551 [Polypedilum vanderplanki]
MNKIKIYKNAHVMIRRKNITNEIDESKKFNVLLIGVDSISRLHLQRSMQETYKFLIENQWIEMKGYNKIEDNTFPNLMAILAGVDNSYSFKYCNITEIGGIEKCKFLWNEFKDENYATAFAEDTTKFSTFNFMRMKGFSKQPTDHYFRPFGLAIEKYLDCENKRFPYCVGEKVYADYIYDYALDFVKEYKNYFGLFWTNSFSHNFISTPSSYDLKMKNYLKMFQNENHLNNTFIIFISDHGIRFGEIRKLFTGWLEERLPFLFFYIPENFKKNYPEFVKNLKINTERLTTPFDLHITIKEILKISSNKNQFFNLTAISCPKCQSLFKEISIDRICKDAAIPDIYCTCSSIEEIDKTTKEIKEISEFIVDELNFLVSTYEKCAKMKLKEIISARKLNYDKNDFLIEIKVFPSDGEFEAKVRKTENFYIFVDQILRINQYGNQSECIDDLNLRKYCYCV